MSVLIRRWDTPRSPAETLDMILPAYEEIYAEPPYLEGARDIADFIDRYQRQVTDYAGFRIAIASDDDSVIGFAFGFLLPPDSSWWDAALSPLPSDFTRETGQRTFVVIELAVRKRWRRQGIAKRLHAELLSGLDIERVTLTVRPEIEAEAAQTAYRSWGYRQICRSRPWSEAPLYDLLILPIASGHE